MSLSSVRRCLLSLLLSLTLLPLSAVAGDDREALPFSKLSFPEPEREYSAETECVAPEDEMRRNHMNYILHQRDETVHQGIRTRQFSLEECVNCHTAKDDKGEYIAIDAPDQFCSSCHTYTSVSIDCFQCHATKPGRPSTLELETASVTDHGKFEQIHGKLSENAHESVSPGGQAQ